MKKYSILLVAVFALSYSNAQIDRTKQPEPGPAPVIQLNDPTSFTLKNGLTVLLVKNSKLPQVSISLTVDNPLRVEGKKAGTNTLLSAMMGKGSTSISLSSTICSAFFLLDRKTKNNKIPKTKKPERMIHKFPISISEMDLITGRGGSLTKLRSRR